MFIFGWSGINQDAALLLPRSLHARLYGPVSVVMSSDVENPATRKPFGVELSFGNWYYPLYLANVNAGFPGYSPAFKLNFSSVFLIGVSDVSYSEHIFHTAASFAVGPVWRAGIGVSVLWKNVLSYHHFGVGTSAGFYFNEFLEIGLVLDFLPLDAVARGRLALAKKLALGKVNLTPFTGAEVYSDLEYRAGGGLLFGSSANFLPISLQGAATLFTRSDDMLEIGVGIFVSYNKFNLTFAFNDTIQGSLWGLSCGYNF